MTDLNAQLREAILARGAALVGFADLHQVPEGDRLGFPRSLSLAVALDPRIVAAIREHPTEEYVGEYDRRNRQLAELGDFAAELLQTLGYEAVALPPTKVGVDPETISTRLPHKTSATRAGLGWIGKPALVVTPEYGPAVRFTTVLTDAPIVTGTPIDQSRCRDCAVCTVLCPAQAVTGRNWRLGMERAEIFDAFACQATAKGMASRYNLSYGICGRCVAVCPYTEAYLRREGAL